MYMIILLCGSQTWTPSTLLIISNFCNWKDVPRMNSGSWIAQLIDKFVIREKKKKKKERKRNMNRKIYIWCRNALGVCVSWPDILLGLNLFKWPGTTDKCLIILAVLTKIISWGKVTMIQLISLMWTKCEYKLRQRKLFKAELLSSIEGACSMGQLITHSFTWTCEFIEGL